MYVDLFEKIDFVFSNCQHHADCERIAGCVLKYIANGLRKHECCPRQPTKV